MIEVIGSSPLYSSRRFREAGLPWLGFHSLWQVALRLGGFSFCAHRSRSETWLMSLPGTKRSSRCRRHMSVVGGKAESICSVRVFRILTHLGLRLKSNVAVAKAISALSKDHSQPVEWSVQIVELT